MKKEEMLRLPPKPDCELTPPMLVHEISRLFCAWLRTNSGEAVGVMSQTGAKMLMRQLAHADGVSQLDLVKATRLKPPTVSLTLRKMEAEGIVRREINENDQRAVRVFLTEKGRGYDTFVRDNLHRADQLVMQDFSPEEYEVAKKVLIRMRNNILADLMSDGRFPADMEDSVEKGKGRKA